MRCHLLAVTAVAALAAVPSTAAASSLTYEGDALVLRAAPGEANFVGISSDDPVRIAISDSGTAAMSFPGDRCTQISPDHPAQCDIPARVIVELGDGNDNAYTLPSAPNLPVTFVGGAGTDKLKNAAALPANLLGGDGADELESEAGNDVLRGGEGDDKMIGGAGDDQLYGDGGDDVLQPDRYTDGNDIVDGGAGYDQVDDWADNSSEKRGKRVNITLDGQANDGRPGERDNVANVEFIKAFAPGTYTMSEGSDRVEVYAPSDLGASTVNGLGGDDFLLASNGQQTIDGGAGSDTIEGGFGDDTLTGGPGRDTIAGDFTGSQCGILQSCTLPHGNDVIYAADGEVDTIDCGVGTDRAVVDASDVVSNCETVERGTSSQADTSGTTATANGAKVTLAKRVGLRAALQRGVKVKLTGLPAGKKVTVKAKAGKRIVATGRAKAAANGSATVTLKFTKAGKRALKNRKTVTLAITAATVTGKVTLKR